jgi:hypothetical protein
LGVFLLEEEHTIVVLDHKLFGEAAISPKKPSAWYLAQKAIVTLSPAPERGQILWPADVAVDSH